MSIHVHSKKNNYVHNWRLYPFVEGCVLYVLAWTPQLVNTWSLCACVKRETSLCKNRSLCARPEGLCNVSRCLKMSLCADLRAVLICSVHCVILVQSMKLQFRYFWGPWAYTENFVRYLYTRKHQWVLWRDMYACAEEYVQAWKHQFVHVQTLCAFTDTVYCMSTLGNTVMSTTVVHVCA